MATKEPSSPDRRYLSTLIRRDESLPVQTDEAAGWIAIHSVPMTYASRTVRAITMPTASSIEPELWSHPMLDLYRRESAPHVDRAPLLYAMPSQFGEEYDPEFAPQPTSATQLPDLRTWTLKFGVSVLEIWAAKRQPAQLSRWCHHTIYSELVRKVGSQQEVGRIRKLHQCEPLDGISESTITVRFEKRVRSIALRFEGVDHRWLCTSLTLL